MNAAVAIVILNLNGRTLLDDCLSSLSQLTVPAEVVVADNGSTDDSVDYVRTHFPAVRVLELSTTNLGFAEGYNRALAAVNQPWVVLLNNDARLEPTWLEHLLAVAAQNPRAAILGGKLIFSGPTITGRVLQSAGAQFTDSGAAFEIGWGQPDEGQYDLAGPVGSIPGAALLIRRETFFELGGFDATYFAYLEDVALCWKAWLAGYEVIYDPRAVAYHRFGASGGGRASPFRIRLMQRNRLANMVKYLEPASLLQALPISIAYDAYRLLEYTWRGHWAASRALLEGRLAFWRNLRPILEQRAAIQRGRRIGDRDLRRRGLLVPAWTAFLEYRRLNRLSSSWH
jgi:GT2 family glycosyltransferase